MNFLKRSKNVSVLEKTSRKWETEGTFFLELRADESWIGCYMKNWSSSVAKEEADEREFLKVIKIWCTDTSKPQTCRMGWWLDLRRVDSTDKSLKSVWRRMISCSSTQVVLFYSDLQLIRWGPPTLWRAMVRVWAKQTLCTGGKSWLELRKQKINTWILQQPCRGIGSV